MAAKDFRVKCPMCSGIIVVDARNGKIIRHHEPGKEDEDEVDPALFDSALDKVRAITDPTLNVGRGQSAKYKRVGATSFVV